ncbi:MAG: histidine kinase [Actinobacteria bacterium]|nr:histidine kinase [Actinomycetota bacterium]
MLAEEQAALRWVATLVARGAPQEELFAAVAEEVGRLLSVASVAIGRYESDGTMTIVATWGRLGDRFPVGGRWTLGGKNLVTIVLETGRPARIDSYADASGSVGAAVREEGIGSGVGTPIIVEGRLWGVMTVLTKGEPLAPDTEERLANFTELMATAIANSESRAALGVLADEQAALRRVATLVARGLPPTEIFAALAEEVGRLLSIAGTRILRYEADGTATVIGGWSESVEVPLELEVGARLVLEGESLSALVFRTGRPARIDSYAAAAGPLSEPLQRAGVRAAAGAPIIVEGRLWGVMTAGSTKPEPLPSGTELRLAEFTELVATAIANAESRAGLARLADEQAALRRVATLVAHEAPPEELFAVVTEEVGRLLSVDYAHLGRYESDGTTMTIVAGWGRTGGDPIAPRGGPRWSLGGKNVSTLVFQTGRAARIDGFADASGPLGVAARDDKVGSGVGTPVIVEGRLWGVMSTHLSLGRPLAADTEARLASFTELVATAIANAESGAQLIASRARIAAAADETRRRIERDLHDGIQQRLVSLQLQMRAVQTAVPPQLGELERDLSRVAEGLASAFDELREISRGIHPAILSEGGLGPALRTLARRSAVPVELDLHADRRLPERVEVAAYYVVSEALTNAAKHAHASVVKVEVDTHDAILQLAIRDDGLGGADPSKGSGLVGLSDRIEALGGTLQVTSPAGSGTTLLIEVPLEGQSSAVASEP